MICQRGAGVFQISCYPANEKSLRANIQKADKENLSFIEKRMDDDKTNIHLWFCSVDDHIFMAKYIYGKEYEKTELIKKELEKVKSSLLKAVYISEENRSIVFGIDKYEKFQSALAASFDLKDNAINSNSLIEFIIIVANQIDAYLRLCIVMTIQLKDMTNSFDLKYFYQGEDDKPIMERKIYFEANKLGVIPDEVFINLEALYKKRNKLVHRYVISELRTKNLLDIAYEYEGVSEEIRTIMIVLEDAQRSNKIGIYKDSVRMAEDLDQKNTELFFAGVNDKHLVERFKRKL